VSDSLQLELLGTSGCHLCDIAEKIVRRIAPPLGAKVKLVDIADSDTLVEQFGMSIPVLRYSNEQTLCWPFDEQQLIHWLESL
jgi:hypothetical protein